MVNGSVVLILEVIVLICKIITSNWKSYQNHETQFRKCQLGKLEIKFHQNYIIDYPINSVKQMENEAVTMRNHHGLTKNK